ncbi:hypothetical protein ACFS07_17400 [Undibacterium arcticum]
MQPPPPFPSLTGGLLDRNANGEINAPAGLLSPHGTVRHKGLVGRFDDLVGLGFVLILRNAAHGTSVTPADRACLAGMNGKIVHLGDQEDGNGEEVIVDLDKKFTPFMDGHGIVAMLVRPDFYIYGGATAPSEISGLIERLAIDLGKYGFKRAGESNNKAEEGSEARL